MLNTIQKRKHLEKLVSVQASWQHAYFRLGYGADFASSGGARSDSRTAAVDVVGRLLVLNGISKRHAPGLQSNPAQLD